METRHSWKLGCSSCDQGLSESEYCRSSEISSHAREQLESETIATHPHEWSAVSSQSARFGFDCFERVSTN